MIKIFFPINPEPKLRARFTRSGHAYTPTKTATFEKSVRFLAVVQRPQILEGPLHVELDFAMAPPKRLKNSHPISRPDIDNLAKAICDALNGVCWKDDAQICKLTARKFYDMKTRAGSISMRVSKIDAVYQQEITNQSNSQKVRGD